MISPQHDEKRQNPASLLRKQGLIFDPLLPSIVFDVWMGD